MDDAPIDEPGQRLVETRQVFEGETILLLEGVQEVDRAVSSRRRPNMEVIVTILALVTGLAVLGGASIGWGVDSRDAYPDDHRR